VKTHTAPDPDAAPNRARVLAARRGSVALARLAYSPDQPRDDHGRFGEGSGGRAEESGYTPPSALTQEVMRQGFSRKEADRRVESLKQSEARVQAAFPNARVDLGAMNSKLAEGVANQSEKFAEEFPTAAGMMQSVEMGQYQNDSAFAVALHDANQDGTNQPGILFNERWYTDMGAMGPAVRASAELKSGTEMAFHPSGKTESVVAHELGHVLDKVYGVTEGNVGTFFGRPVNAVSGYGTTNKYENFAEAFAARQMGVEGVNPSTMGVLTGVLQDVNSREPLVGHKLAAVAAAHDHGEDSCVGYIPPEVVAKYLPRPRPLAKVDYRDKSSPRPAQ
jgi:hypothetical protein